jgi:hypothetical protein
MSKILKAMFDIGQIVYVNNIKMLGKVKAISFDASGTQYRVIYWHNGNRYVKWVDADEISIRPGDKHIE